MNINISELINVVFRAFISLIALFLVAKLIGKKQVSQLSLFDYVIGISIGNFAAEMTINLESQTMNGILAVFSSVENRFRKASTLRFASILFKNCSF